MCNDGVSREVNSGIGVGEEIKQQQDNAQTTFSYEVTHLSA